MRCVPWGSRPDVGSQPFGTSCRSLHEDARRRPRVERPSSRKSRGLLAGKSARTISPGSRPSDGTAKRSRKSSPPRNEPQQGRPLLPSTKKGVVVSDCLPRMQSAAPSRNTTLGTELPSRHELSVPRMKTRVTPAPLAVRGRRGEEREASRSSAGLRLCGARRLLGGSSRRAAAEPPGPCSAHGAHGDRPCLVRTSDH